MKLCLQVGTFVVLFCRTDLGDDLPDIPERANARLYPTFGSKLTHI